MPRPILIDKADGPCEACALQISGKCYDCDNTGRLSVGPDDDHYHLTMVEGIPGREAIAFNRCDDCYEARRVALATGKRSESAPQATKKKSTKKTTTKKKARK